MLCCEQCLAIDVHCVLRCVILAGYTTWHAATIHSWYSEINVTLYSVTLARTIWLSDDGPRAETCRRVFSVLVCKLHKFYICAVVGTIIE